MYIDCIKSTISFKGRWIPLKIDPVISEPNSIDSGLPVLNTGSSIVTATKTYNTKFSRIYLTYLRGIHNSRVQICLQEGRTAFPVITNNIGRLNNELEKFKFLKAAFRFKIEKITCVPINLNCRTTPSKQMITLTNPECSTGTNSCMADPAIFSAVTTP